MWFWWFMLICDMIIPIVMVITGRMRWKHCTNNSMFYYDCINISDRDRCGGAESVRRRAH